MNESRKKGMFQYRNVVQERDGTLTVGGIKGIPDITQRGSIGELSAWFLGPRAENKDLLRNMINLAIDKTVAYRMLFEPDDPAVITDDVKQTAEYKNGVESMTLAYSNLVDFLQTYATPYFSMRYQGHMLWDNTLPSLCAYFATMLHNPNNVTIQASSATTPLEILVGWDLCEMVGFPVNEDEEKQEFNPWAHITCDGSIANIETCWASRETKFLPFSLRRLLTETRSFLIPNAQNELLEIIINNKQNPITVTTCDGTNVCLTDPDIDSWMLFNIPMDEILGLPKKIAETYQIEEEYVVWSAVVPFTMNYVGLPNMMQYIRKMSPDAKMPVIIGASTMHYSLLKAAALTGYGFGAFLPDMKGDRSHGCVFNIPVDADARMNMVDLENILQYCHDNKIPITQVIGVVGSTEEGAVDSLEKILTKRDSYRAKGLEYFVHADAAWGGYMITSMRNPYTLSDSVSKAEENPNLPPYNSSKLFVAPEDSPLSDYVFKQYSKICKCDSVTIDPHKMGYIQYPAGAILYRNGIIRRLTTFTGAYIGGTGSVNPGKEPTVGIFGLEGSKPGAAAAAVFLSHRVIRPDVTGHGKLIRQCMENTRLFALYMLALSQQSKHYHITLLTNNGKLESQIGEQSILSMKPKEVIAALTGGDTRNFGPDLNILNYVFNPLDEQGFLNQSVDRLNDFNNAVYDKFHVPVSETAETKLPVPIEDFPKYFITKTTFHRKEYGGIFIDNFINRIFKDDSNTNKAPVASIVCLRSTVMDPFMPYAQHGDFFKAMVKLIDQTLVQLVIDWRKKKGRVFA